MNIGVLASHEGHTLQTILDSCRTGAIRARVSIVISNNRDAGALRRATAAGVRQRCLSSKDFATAEELDRAIASALLESGTDLVFLAGYMKKVGPHVLQTYRERVLNVHPSLLPKFGGQGYFGLKVHEAALAAHESESGVSIHIVDARYDTGPVIAQRRVRIDSTDSPQTLAKRVEACGRELVIDTLATLADAMVENVLEGKPRAEQLIAKLA